MRLTASRDELADATRWAARQLPTKPIIPVLSGLRLNTTDGQLTISGFNYDTGGTVTLDADTMVDGTVVAPGRLLADIVAALPAGTVELDATDNELTVALGSRDRFTLPLLPTNEYPTLPAAPAPTGTVAAADFADAVAHVATAAMAQADAVGAVEGMGGIHITASTEHLTFAATDRYRVAMRTIPWRTDRHIEASMLLPAPSLAGSAKALAGTGELQLAFPTGGGVAGIQTADMALTVRTMACDFPPVLQHTPSEDNATGTFEVDPGDLAKAAARAALVNDKNKPVRLTMRGDHADIEGRGDGPASRTSIDAQIDGLDDGWSIAFNPHFLASLLAPINGPARIWMYQPTRPVLIRPADKDFAYTAVLMPIRLSHA